MENNIPKIELSIEEALWLIQKEFTISKNTKNYNFTYTNLAGMLPKLREICEKNKLWYTIRLVSQKIIGEIKTIETTEKGIKKLKFLITYELNWKLTIGIVGTNKYKEYDISDEVTGLDSIPEYVVGKVKTYSRRYALLNFFNADDGGEYDAEKQKKPIPKQQKKPVVPFITPIGKDIPIDPEKVKALKMLRYNLGILMSDEAKILKQLGVKMFELLPLTTINTLIVNTELAITDMKPEPKDLTTFKNTEASEMNFKINEIKT